MKILKFGGTSVGTPERINSIIEIVGSYLKKEPVGIVVSAFSGTTDALLTSATLASKGNIAYKDCLEKIKTRHFDTLHSVCTIPKTMLEVTTLLKELEEILHGMYLVKEMTPKTRDLIASFGERLSAIIIASAFESKKIPAEYLDARLLIKTDNNFGEASVLFEETFYNITTHFASIKKLQVITGFIASTKDDETTTLGRGGSDYTGTIFGTALNSSQIEIWTDVNGFMTSNPKLVPDAFSIQSLSYEEAIELAHFGAKVMHPASIHPAMQKNIPIIIKNTFNPSFEGTKIHTARLTSMSTKPIRYVQGVSAISDIAIIRIQATGAINISELARRTFDALEKSKTNVVLTSQASSEQSICLAVRDAEATRAIDYLEKEFEVEKRLRKIDEIALEKGFSVVAIIGDNMQKKVGVAGKFFYSLSQNGINIVAIAQGSSERNISIIIKDHLKEKALNVTHQAFFLSNLKTVNLFMIGVGLIGKTFLKQLSSQLAFLEKNYSLRFKLIGAAKSKKMYFNSAGIDFTNVIGELESKGETMEKELFIQKMIASNLPNSIFIDCTANQSIASIYGDILDASISIVTPNKRACSSNYEYYQELKQIEKKRGVLFLYETNVGAGLPIIRTLKDLIQSGDKIVKIEAVLSGSLSYIFNSFSGNRKFSDVVREAREKGYTEPDPRDDLSGMDVARKILILAREAGAKLELQDIAIESFLPEQCMKATSIDNFFVELTKLDSEFEKKKKELESKSEKLRFIAIYENGKAMVTLRSVSNSHPFYGLGGSDNIISFTTDRYKERQLVVQGPGAGAEVTAAGVFADIMLIANYLL